MHEHYLAIQEESKQYFLDKGWWQYGPDLVMVQQNIRIKDVFTKLIKEELPSLVIEIGTSFGGLTVILADIIKDFNPDIKLISYDNATRGHIPDLAAKYEFEYRAKSIGDPETDQEICKLIKETSGKVIVLCDGGGKIYEFNTFSSCLKPQDIIGAHDYADNIEEFKSRMQNKSWNWFEIEHAHIDTAITEAGLVDLQHDLTEEGKDVAWILKQKP